jgi:hypothetical protein
LALQTCPDAHAIEQPPQWVAFDETHVPLQASSPELQRHWPF